MAPRPYPALPWRRSLVSNPPTGPQDLTLRSVQRLRSSSSAFDAREPLGRPHRVSAAATIALAALAALAAIGLVSCSTPKTTTAVIPGTSSTGTVAVVTHVVDGDTVDLRFGDGRTERVRLLGIDTPETVKPNTPVQCFGPEASARTKELLTTGTDVLIQRDAEARDRYGRLLAYIWRRQDGLFVNRDLVDGGYARTLAIAPNNAHRADLSAAAAAARATGTGLWSACPATDDGS